MRDATEQEQKSIDDYVKSISRPTGFNAFNEPYGDVVSKEAILKVLTKLGYGDEENGADAEYMSALVDVAKEIESLPRIKFAEDIVKEINERGTISVPENCMTGEEYEKWLYEKGVCK